MDTSYQGITAVHPLALTLLVVLCAWTLASPRRLALIPIILLSSLISDGQRVVLAGLDFSFIRILLLTGLVRVFLRGEIRPIRTSPVDVFVLLAVLLNSVVFYAQTGTADALISRLGRATDILGTYVVARLLLRDWEDLLGLAQGVVWATLICSVAFAIEMTTQRNFFSVFGGPVPWITVVRDGRLRCQGAFSHPIIAGVFWVTLVPMLSAIRHWGGGSTLVTKIAVVGILLIIWSTGSSTPLVALFVVFAGLAMYRFRQLVPVALWGMVFLGLTYSVLTSKPVWRLLARIDLTGSSTGYHRFLLIDGAIRHFDIWWLRGANQLDFITPGFWDVTNQYLAEGFQGGFFAMLCFMLAMIYGFVGLRRAFRMPGNSEGQRRMIWALGVTLTAHAWIFLAVAYFGQMTSLYYLQLAAIAAMPEIAALGSDRADVPEHAVAYAPAHPRFARAPRRRRVSTGP